MNHSNKTIRGLSLIELMVSMAIGLVLVAAIGYAYLGGSAAYRQQEALARMQEGARFAFETLTYDVRMAGFTGCRSTTSVNVLNGNDWYGNLFNRALMGYETGTMPPGVGGSTADSLVVLRADNSKEYVVTGHNPLAAQFDVAGTHDLKQGEILVVTNCDHTATFQMTNPTTNNVVHNSGNVTNPGNCTKGFGETAAGSGVPDCTTTNGVAYTFAPGSRLLRMSGNIYFIAANPAGVPSLYRQRLVASGGNAATTAEELVEGVEDMQIRYGVDTSSPATCSQSDGTVDTYVTASAVTATAPCATDEDDWKKVLSVRVSLLMRTENGIVSQAQSYFYDNPMVATTAADRRLRKVFTTTIAVRNRL